jgi:uncharacterized protein (TIGR04255 family)
MEKPARYSKPPITEAIIAINVTPAKGLTVGAVERFAESLPEYPERKRIRIGHSRIQFGEKPVAETSTSDAGLLVSNASKTHVLQTRVDGFIMSRLAPYEHWEPFRAEARRLWSAYREMTKPLRIERLAVRYVNRFDFPLPLIDLDDYLRTAPSVSPDMPFSIAGYFMQLNIPQHDIGCTLLLNQTNIEPARPEVVSIVLDIDLFRDKELPQNEDDLWQLCEVLRARKNKIFEACITERTRELIR